MPLRCHVLTAQSSPTSPYKRPHAAPLQTQVPKLPQSEDPVETVLLGCWGRKREGPLALGHGSQLGPPAHGSLHHAVGFSPLVDVLLAHDVRVDQEVSVTHTEVLLAGGTLETF